MLRDLLAFFGICSGLVALCFVVSAIYDVATGRCRRPGSLERRDFENDGAE